MKLKGVPNMKVYAKTNVYGTKSLYYIDMYGKRTYIKVKEINALTLALSQGMLIDDIDTGRIVEIFNINDLWIYTKNNMKGG